MPGVLKVVRDGSFLGVIAEREEQAELARLFYVATTRAADYLILSAGLPQLGTATGPWMKLLQRQFPDASGDSAEERQSSHEHNVAVKVTTTEPPLESLPNSGHRNPDLRRSSMGNCRYGK